MSVERVVTEEEKRRTAAEALQVLAQIEACAISIDTDGATWAEVYDGLVTFLAGNGWRFTVYLDAGDWDYFDKIISADGTVLDFDWISDNSVELYHYSPSHYELWENAGPNLQARSRAWPCA